MKLRVASLLLAFSFIALPVFAQGPPSGVGPGGVIASLANDLAALTARVAKLEGNIVASDLAGTYAFVGLDTVMTGFRAGTPPHFATVETMAFRGTITLNVGGPGSISTFGGGGTRLNVGTGALTGLVDPNDAEDTLTWTYANGVVTITFLSDGDAIPFVVALGGRFLIQGYAPFHASDPSSDQFLFIATRLR